ncbi:MAG: hypothetical protein V3V67_03040 [Myxococcota bacterium]
MAYYARDDFLSNPELLEMPGQIFQGKLSLDWMEVDTEKVRCRPSHAERGLTYDDINVGSYGWEAIPEKIRHNFSMAPRGCFMPPGLPSLGYDINRKSEVWSDNAAELYEESKSRQWTPTLAVPWTALEQLGHPQDVERALAQLYTDLTGMAMVLGDVPSKWVWHINHELLEVKSWQCAQMFDAAQLADIFRKRAIAGGTGLGRDHAPLGELLKGVIDSGTYPCVSLAAHIVLCGLVQVLLRQIGASSHNLADQTIAIFGMQDVSRSLAYGVGHIRYLLAERPHEERSLVGHLHEVENLLIGLLGSPLFFSVLALVTGGGREQASGAVPWVVRLYRTLSDEHSARCAAAGLGGGRRGPLAEFVRDLEAA